MHEHTVKSARRVVEIFELFAKARRRLTLKDIMVGLDYPASSASNILKSMVRTGILDYDSGEHTYMPTLRMPQLVSWVEPARFAGGQLLAAMRHLHEATSETICLGTQSDLYAQYIHSIQTKLPAPFERKPLTVRPLTGCGLGWLLLSAGPDQRIERIVRRINYDIADHAKRVRLPELMAQVNKVRRDGYVFSRNTVVVGGGMIGMLIPDGGGARPLALSVHGPIERLEAKQDRILFELRCLVRSLDEAAGADLAFSGAGAASGRAALLEPAEGAR